LFGSTAKGTALGAGAGGEEIEDGSIGREREREGVDSKFGK
jgi:hypothetical protein